MKTAEPPKASKSRYAMENAPEETETPKSLSEKIKHRVSDLVEKFEALSDDDLIDFVGTKKGKAVIGGIIVATVLAVGVATATYASTDRTSAKKHRQAKPIAEEIIENAYGKTESPKKEHAYVKTPTDPESENVTLASMKKDEILTTGEATVRTVADIEAVLKAYAEMENGVVKK